MEKFKSHIPCIGFACISLLFIVSGVSKIVDFEAAQGYLASKDIGATAFLIGLAIVAEIGGGLMVLFKKRADIGAGILSLYLIVVTLIFHVGDGQMVSFFTNLAILGGLILVKYMSCGSCSSSGKKSKKSEGKCCGGSCACG